MLFYHNMGLFLSVRLYSTEIRPSAGTTTKKRVCCNFSKKWLNVKEDSVKKLPLLINRQLCVWYFRVLKLLCSQYNHD